MSLQAEGERSLDPVATLHLERLCDRFEEESRQGARPRIEDYLGEADPAWRRHLLHHLLVLDLEYQAREGTLPPLAEWIARFPEHEATVCACYAEHVKADAQASTRDMGPSTPGTSVDPGHAAKTSSLPDFHVTPNPESRYERLEVVGTGGVGVVHRCLDRHLGRELALKVLREDQELDSDRYERFRAEAQIGSQLQHPAIAPVYDQGFFANGRPYFTMKLVRGSTLSKLLAARSDTSEDLVRFLGIFEQLCQAVAYAHSRGVIHRDLKPANVMVGAFGEIQVMDWGLAKVLSDHEPEPAERKPAEPVRTGRAAQGDSATRVGTLLGTPAYMPPEQAEGDLRRVDQRSDVFSLGAILCEILTGRPPHAAAAEASEKALPASTMALQLLQPATVDPALQHLVLRCLAEDPGERPQEVAVVASEVTRYLESLRTALDEERLARERAQVQVAAEARRRKLWLGLALALAGLMTTLAVGGFYWQHQQARYQRAVTLGEEDLRRARQLIELDSFPAATAALDQFRARLGDGGPASLQTEYSELRTAVNLVSELQRIERERAQPNKSGLFDNARALREYEATFREFDLDVEQDLTRLAQKIRGARVREHVLASLDNWALVCEYRTRWDPSRKPEYLARRDRLLQLAVAVDPHPELRDKIRDSRIWDDRERLEELAASVDAESLSPRLAALLGELIRFTEGNPEPLLRKFQFAYPDDFWLNYDLGKYLLLVGDQPNESARFLQAALAQQPGHAYLLVTLGNAVRRSDPTRALLYFRQAVRAEPELLFAYVQLAATHGQLGEIEQACDWVARAEAIAPDNAELPLVRAQILHNAERWEEAVADYRKGLKLAPQHIRLTMTGIRPAVEDRAWLGNVHFMLAEALQRSGQETEAVEHYREALRQNPEDTEARKRIEELMPDADE